MKLENIVGLKLPQKKQEEFRKIDFTPFITQDFDSIHNLQIKNLESFEDKREYKSILFDITRTLERKQKRVVISEDTAKPYMFVHSADIDNMLFLNSLEVYVKKGVKARIIDIFVDDCEQSALSANRQITLEEGASVEYLKIQDVQNTLLYNLNITQQKNSTLSISNLEYGKGFIVNTVINEMNEPDVNYSINGLVKLVSDAKCSNLIKTIHNEQNCISDILYKNTLKDKSKAVFKATSIVHEKALFTKAYQNCNNILLSDDARVISEPHLEIFIDELEASHGTTTGSLDKEALLYLQSRGIGEQKAYDMLLNAFEKEIIDKIEDEKLKDVASRYVRSDYVQR